MLAKLGNYCLYLLTSTTLSLLVLCTNLPTQDAIAVSIKTIDAAQATNGTVTIAVWSGVGQNIFMPKGEKIQKVWLDDPSRITLDFDTPLCSSVNNNCDGSGASVIHLRRIHPLNFQHLPKTGSTLLTVITDQNRYLFRVIYGTGHPQYLAVEIFSPHQELQKDSISFENWVEQGLEIAQKQGLIAEKQKNLDLIQRVKNFLGLYKSGQPQQQAAFNAGVSTELINKLVEMGEKSTPSPCNSDDLPVHEESPITDE